MGLFNKIKDILFEEEETQPIKIEPEVDEQIKNLNEVEVKTTKVEEEKKEEVVAPKEEARPSIKSERELFKSSNDFNFPDFDEAEFDNNMSKYKTRSNVLEYERKIKTSDRRNDYPRYAREEQKEIVEKKKFKPSPIISPVYGILNQDYKAEDIKDVTDRTEKIDIDEVRKRAFEVIAEEPQAEKIDEPVVTFFEDKESIKVEDDETPVMATRSQAYEDFDTDIEIPKMNNIDAIEEELEKIDTNIPKKIEEDSADTDLFDLIDSMYEDKEEE